MGGTISFCDPKESPSKSSTASGGPCFVLFGSFNRKDDLFFNEDDFRHNLIRNRSMNVLEIYKVVEVLGKGSMGSVSIARKRAEKVGGSARTSKFKNRLLLPDSYHGKYLSDSYHCSNKYFAPTEVFDLSERTNQTDGSESSSGYDSNSFRNSTYSKVLRVKKKASVDQHMYALKTINADLVGDRQIFDEMLNEIGILRNLDHPNIVRALEVYQARARTGNEICIIMELCTGGDLYSRDPYTENDAAKIIGKILSAVEYMHNNNIIHRDLKYENILFESKAPNAEVKIIDFGLSKRYDPNNNSLCEGVGTIYTMAPQVLDGIYDEQADLWSCGVITYMLLSSSLPFHGRKRRHVIRKIMNCQYDFSGYRWKSISNEAMKFVSQLLVIDPQGRMTARQGLSSEWQNEHFKLSDRRPSDTFMDNVLGALETYASYGKFKKLSLMVIAQKSSLDAISHLRSAFDQYDILNNGEITKPEFKKALANYNYTNKELNAIFDAIDVDESGLIHYTEFLAATLEMLGVIEEEELAEAFDRLDSDGSGFISPQNISELLGKSSSNEQIADLLAEADKYKDNQISYEEFLTMFHDQQPIRDEKVKKIIERKTKRERVKNNLSSQ